MHQTTVSASCCVCGSVFRTYKGHDKCGKCRLRKQPLQRPCDWCGVAVSVGVRAASNRIFCCRDHNKWHHLWRSGILLSRPLPPKPLRGRMVRIGRCLWCGRPFMGARKYCTERCMRATPGAHTDLHRGACATCGEVFVGSPDKIYCDPACRPGSRKWIGERRRRRLYQRDGWVCQICGEATDPEDFERKPGGDGRLAVIAGPSFPSLDHIVPRSLGGSHASSNLRTAHFKCNTERGNEWLGDQLSLLAA